MSHKEDTNDALGNSGANSWLVGNKYKVEVGTIAELAVIAHLQFLGR